MFYIMSIDLAFLANNYLFKDLTSDELETIQHLATKHTFHTGDTIIIEGQPVENLAIILSGEVEVKKSAGPNKALHRVATLHQGETIGEMYLLDLSFDRFRSLSVHFSLPP